VREICGWRLCFLYPIQNLSNSYAARASKWQIVCRHVYSKIWCDELVVRIFFVEPLCGLHKKVMLSQWLAADKRVPAEVEVVQVILARIVAVDLLTRGRRCE
jgi:hypothetical protein